MQFNDLLQNDNVASLTSKEAIQVSLGKLPKGTYQYNCVLHNLTATSGTIQVQFIADGKVVDQQIFAINDLIQPIAYNLSVESLDQDLTLHYKLNQINSGLLYFPISPIMITASSQSIPFFDLADEISNRVDELKPKPQLKNQIQSTQISTEQIDLKKLESFVNSRYFKGFLSLEDAERQLDYVIYYKMFSLSDAKGLKKFKKKIYRRILYGTYRLLTRTRSRKLYFAKLYRNYVNSNLLSENYHN